MQLAAPVLLIIYLTVVKWSEGTHYEPNWKSIDSRPLPPWFDQSKIGIFMHWGVFSVPAYKSAWFWWFWKGSPLESVVEFMKKNYKPDFTYADFASQFTTEFYDANHWADILKRSGARYVVLVTKHHEGFTNWPSKHSWNWNSKDVGPNRDLVGELADAIKNRTDMHFGVYHSMFEFFNPLWLKDQKNNFTTQDYVWAKPMPELYELINNYKPDVLWSDGAWLANSSYWNSTDFLAWLYNDSPVKDTIVTNDRWGSDTACKHGGYYNCADKFNPGVLQKHKWENAMTLDKHGWTHRRDINYEDVLSMDELLDTLAKTISCGGNILINVGPTRDGTIIPIFQERLLQLGEWLNVTGEAIYHSVPWTHQNDTVTKDVWYTAKVDNADTSVYALISNWPENELHLGAPQPSDSTIVTLLGYEGNFSWTDGPEGGIIIKIPPIPFYKMPCQWSWVFKFEGLNN